MNSSISGEGLRNLLKAMFLAGCDTGVSFHQEGYSEDQIHEVVTEQFDRRCVICINGSEIQIKFLSPEIMMKPEAQS